MENYWLYTKYFRFYRTTSKIVSGKYFGPDVVGAFLELEKDIRDIAFKYAYNDKEHEILDQ